MEQPIEVLVSPANDDNSFLESVSTHSNGRGEGEKDHCSDDDDDEEFKQDNLNVPKMLGSDQGGVEDESHVKMETVRHGSAGRGSNDGSSSAPLANITRTLQLAKSWLNKSREKSAKRTPRVDSFLEKMELAGPSRFSGNEHNNNSHDSASSFGVVDPSNAFHYYWLLVVSVCVVYNWVFIIARSAFEDLQNGLLVLWLVMDYISDGVYILDMLIQFKTGK